jgi:PEP-CTERM motif
VTDTAEGWVPFVFVDTITSPTGQAWVAVGVRVAWETHRDYWVDHVVVSTTVIPGDYNFDGTVDAADYVMWRKNDNSQAGYDAWRAHFGASLGPGSGSALQSADPLSAAVPEPATSVLLILAVAFGSRRRRRIASRVTTTRSRVTRTDNPPFLN